MVKDLTVAGGRLTLEWQAQGRASCGRKAFSIIHGAKWVRDTPGGPEMRLVPAKTRQRE